MPWVKLAPVGDILTDCEVTTAILADSAVTSAKLGDTAVTTAKINNAAVTYAKIQDVTAVRLLGREDAIAGSPQEIALSAELRFDTTNDWLEISDSGVATGLITDSAVTTAKLNNTGVTYAKIQDVTAVRLLGREDALAGSPQEIALSAELRFDTTNDWVEVADSGIITGLIGDSAVTTIKINNLGVTTGKLNDGAVTAAKLYDTTILTRVIELACEQCALELIHEVVGREMLTVAGNERRRPTEPYVVVIED